MTRPPNRPHQEMADRAQALIERRRQNDGDDDGSASVREPRPDPKPLPVLVGARELEDE